MTTDQKPFSIRKYSENAPFYLIAGPCVIETEDLCLHIAGELKCVCNRLGIPLIFKASFDKANRTSGKSFRGPGIETGLEILKKVRDSVGLPILTDVHSPQQVGLAVEVCSIVQIPAFLCRQTDIIETAALAADVVNVKKGQFLSPWDTKNIVEKVKNRRKEAEVILTERGSTFGYGNLVVDMRSFPIMAQWADSVVFDATHSLQLPGAAGNRTGGQREFVPALARAAMATGSVDGLFMEVHPEPEKSACDADNIFPLDRLEDLLKTLLAIKKV